MSRCSSENGPNSTWKAKSPAAKLKKKATPSVPINILLYIRLMAEDKELGTRPKLIGLKLQEPTQKQNVLKLG